MSKDTSTIESEIQAKGLTVPHITIADVENNIASEWYFTAAQGVIGNVDMEGEMPDSFDRLILCVLVLKNGFIVTGESGCASTANFNKELNQNTARLNAFEKVWSLMDYELHGKLHEAKVLIDGFRVPQ